MIKNEAVLDSNQIMRKARAERILDVAADLMQRWGYKRVTIDDIAERADIGKGTIYQHWKTREALFDAVVIREMAEAFEELLHQIRQDPQQTLPHRFFRLELIAVMQRPILRAVFSEDIAMLGKMAKGKTSQVLEEQQQQIFSSYQNLLVEHGLLRNDLSYEELHFMLEATSLGFFLIDTFSATPYHINLERRADLMADVVRRAFELDSSSDSIQAIAPRMIELCAEIVDDYYAQLRKAYE